MKAGQKQGEVNAQYKHLSTQVASDAYERLRVMAIVTRCDLRQIASKAIEDYVERDWKSIKDKL